MPIVPDPLQSHYSTVLRKILDGKVVPFLGAGVNLCDRPKGVQFELGVHLPSGAELAAELARASGYSPEGRVEKCPHCDEDILVRYPLDLLKVSQHMAVMEGSEPLYEELHTVFDANYQPSSLHLFLAELPGIMRRAGSPRPYQLIITTNYDDVLERAFTQTGEPYDLVSYLAEGENRGKFWHWSPDGINQVIETANDYGEVTTDKRTVIMKIHGAVDRGTGDMDSYVITEDHYIDFLARSDISSLVPVMLNMKMRKSHFLFLGYSLRDWNLRVILHRIWGERILSRKSWAIQLNPQQIDLEIWLKRDVQILDLSLEAYVEGLRTQLPKVFDSLKR